MIKPCPHCQRFNRTERRECRKCFLRLDETPSVPASRIITRKAFICKYCEFVYCDAPVNQCDCLGMYEKIEGGYGEEKPKPHFIEGVITYPTPQSPLT